jgi:hypothetical protein
MKIFLIITLLLAIFTEKATAIDKTNNPNSIDKYFDNFISQDFYNEIKKGNFNRNIFPKFSDRKAWEKANKNKYAPIIIQEADKILNDEVKVLTFSEFRRYSTDGNREDYQELYYERRKNLGLLTVAFCLTNNREKYLSKILDYTIAIYEEFTWVVPAHNYWKGDNYTQLGDVLCTDLMSSSTGTTLALVHYLISEELDRYFENLSEKIRQRVLERTVYNVFYNPAPHQIGRLWWFQLGGKKNNWTPWCSYNNLIVAILLEKDNEKLAQFIYRYLQANAYFIAKYGDDGYCNEGPGYYSFAGLKLFEIFHLLHKIRPNSMEKVFAEPKIRAIFEFITKVRIGEKYQVNFGDTHNPVFTPKIEGVAACGKLLNSEPMKAVVANRTATLGTNGQQLNTCLRLLFDVPENLESNNFKQAEFAYFKDRMAILRSDAFTATIKAGNNLESHNHNDLGHFTLFYQGEPIIIDAGTEYYKKANFSNQRYTLWYTRGSGHNAAVFGNIEQMSSTDYTATFPVATKNLVTCNLSNAYPKDAGVKEFLRKLNFANNQVSIEDNFELANPKDVQIKLLSLINPRFINNTTLKFGDVILKLENIQFSKLNQLPQMYGSWNAVVYEIMLMSKNNNYKLNFTIAK